MSEVIPEPSFQETNFVIFSTELRKYMPKSKGLQFFNIFIKFIPLIMITHELNLAESSDINSTLGYFTLKKILKQSSKTALVEALLCLITLFMIFFLILVVQNYRKCRERVNSEAASKVRLMKKLTPFILIIAVFNQNFYEILFWRFTCREESTEQCFTSCHYASIAIGATMSVIIACMSYYFNLIFFQPWFNSDSITPVAFTDKHLFWSFLPLLQGYLAMEAEISADTAVIARYVIRGVVALYMLSFFYNFIKLVYSSIKAYFLIIFIHAFCFSSIILEFIPPLVDSLKDRNFTLIKLLAQVIISLVVVYIIYTKEKNYLLFFKIENRRHCDNLFEIINRFLYVILNFNKNNEERISLVFNNFFENIVASDIRDLEQEPLELYNKIKSFFRITSGEKGDCDQGKSGLSFSTKNKRVNILNKMKVVGCKLGFLVEYLDEIMKSFVVEAKGKTEVVNLSNLLMYTIFCSLVKQNHVSSFFYLEKVNRMSAYRKNYQFRVYANYIKSVLCEEHEESKMKNFPEKIYLKTFYRNLENSEKVLSFLRNAVEALKDMIFKINEKNVSLKDFSNVLWRISQTITELSPLKNKKIVDILESMNKNSETSILMSKYKVLGELVFGKETMRKYSHLIDDVSDHLGSSLIEGSLTEGLNYEAGASDINANSELYMILHLNHEENIIIDKVCTRLKKGMEYEHGGLEGIDLRLVIPPKFANYHKEKTTNFTKSNKDFRKLDVYFVTRRNYAFPLHMTCIIIPTFDHGIKFFSLFHDVNDFNAQEDLSVAKKNKNIFLYTCFAEVSSEGNITKVNKQFEKIFGISKDLVEAQCVKINMFSRLLKLTPEKIFNNHEIVQRYETSMPLSEFIENLKSINFDEFREHSFESYNRLREIMANLGGSCQRKESLFIHIERRIVDNYDPMDFIYAVKIRQWNINPEDGNFISSKEFHSSSIKKTVLTEKKSESVEKTPKGENEKKHLQIITEINKVSANMLKEGNRLWKGEVRYSEINDFNIDKYQIVELARVGKEMGLTSNTNKLEEDILYLSHPQPSIFKLSKFLFFIFVTVVFGVYYSVMLAYLRSQYQELINLHHLIQSLLSVKYSTVLFSFWMIEAFAQSTGKLSLDEDFSDIVKLKETILVNYLQDLDQCLYKFHKLSNEIDQEEIMRIIRIREDITTYKTIHYDFSIFEKNLTIIEATNKLRVSGYNIDYFHNLVFNINSDTFPGFDVNKDFKQASEGDLLIYFIMNNLVEKMIPSFDSIIQENNNLINQFMDKICSFQIIFFTTLLAFLVLIFIFLVVSFYKGKHYVYERYFTNFNVLKFFNFYLIYKVHFLEYLIEDFSKKNFDVYKNICYSVAQVNASSVRFDLENNELNVFMNEVPKKNKRRNNVNLFRKAKTPVSGVFNSNRNTNGRNLEALMLIKREGSAGVGLTSDNRLMQVNSSTNRSQLNTGESNLRLLNRNVDVLRSLNNIGINIGDKLPSSNRQVSAIISTHKNILNVEETKEGASKTVKLSKFSRKPGINPTAEINQNHNSTANFTQLSSSALHRELNSNNNFIGHKHPGLIPLRNSTPKTPKDSGKDLTPKSNITYTTNNNTNNTNNNLILIEEKEKDSPLPKKKNFINDDSYINFRNLLKRNSSFYVDFYYILVLISLLVMLNILSFVLSEQNLTFLKFVVDFTKKSVESSYSEIEITLVYAISLLGNREYRTNESSFYQNKLDDYYDNSKSLVNTLQTYDGTKLQLIDYQRHLLGDNACNHTMWTANRFNNTSDGDLELNIEKCLTIADGIYNKGIYLGLRTVMDNLQHNYQDNIKDNFAKYKDDINDRDMKYILLTEKDVLQKNIDNIKALMNQDTQSVFSSSMSSFNTYFVLFSFLSFLLVVSYCCVYFFIRRSFRFLEDMEATLVNLLK